MSLVDEMSRLIENFAAAFDGRVASIAEGRATTMQQVAGYCNARRTMAAEQCKALGEYASKLHRDSTVAITDIAAARQIRAAEQCKALGEYASKLHRDSTVAITDIAAARQIRAAEMRDRLAGQRAQLLAQVHASRAELQSDLGQAHSVWLGRNSPGRPSGSAKSSKKHHPAAA